MRTYPILANQDAMLAVSTLRPLIERALGAVGLNGLLIESDDDAGYLLDGYVGIGPSAYRHPSMNSAATPLNGFRACEWRTVPGGRWQPDDVVDITLYEGPRLGDAIVEAVAFILRDRIERALDRAGLDACEIEYRMTGPGEYALAYDGQTRHGTPMTNQHTPGPWSVNSWTQTAADLSIGATGTPLIAKVMLRDVSINEQRANARLLAAAPKLLAALKELTPRMPPSNAPCHNGICEQEECAQCARIKRARTAIAEALGEAP